jgi:hypothetical protein
MSSINGFGGIVADWKNVLGAYEYHAELLATAAEDRDLLQRLLQNAERLKSEQDRLQGERQLATQQLNATLTQGKDAAIRIRALARSKLGHKNEQLVQFRIAPTRPRRNRQSPPPIDIGLPTAEE